MKFQSFTSTRISGWALPALKLMTRAALMMLLDNPKILIAGIGSVFGNVPVKDAAVNLARFVDLFGRSDIPLGLGADSPLEGDLAWFAEWQKGYGKTPSYEGCSARNSFKRPADQLRPEISRQGDASSRWDQ